MAILLDIPLILLFWASGITFLAGFVKGAVGFAMPMILISGLGSFLPVETALAALILPTLLSNAWQAFRQGWRGAWESVLRFRIFLLAGLVFLTISAQLVRLLPQGVLFGLIGLPITGFALMQLAGWRPHLRPAARRPVELFTGGFAGFIGGMSGVWGPPLVAYLAAIDTPKAESMRVQGVIYGLGAVALTVAHLQSGVLNPSTLPLSALMCLPALLGMGFGLVLHDRLPQSSFRAATLAVLVIAGVNLVRRGLLG